MRSPSVWSSTEAKNFATTDVQIGGTLEQRTKVTLAVTATDPDGGPAAGDFSIAVTDRAAVPAATSGSIYSTLLLTSELRGYDRDARLVLRGAGRRTGRGARRTAAHAGMAALRRAGADEKGVRGTAISVGGRAGDHRTHQQKRTVEPQEEAEPLRDADDRTLAALCDEMRRRRHRSVRAQRFRLPPTARSTCCVPQQRKGCCRRQR